MHESSLIQTKNNKNNKNNYTILIIYFFNLTIILSTKKEGKK